MSDHAINEPTVKLYRNTALGSTLEDLLQDFQEKVGLSLLRPLMDGHYFLDFRTCYRLKYAKLL